MARNTNPWFKFFSRDWMESERVCLMHPAAQGIYVRALCYQSIHGRIPAERSIIALRLQINPTFMNHWDEVEEQHLTPETVEGKPYFYNERLRSILNHDAEAAEGRRKAAEATNQKRKEKADAQRSGKRSAKPALRASDSDILYSDSEDDFNSFWGAYPNYRKKSRKDAYAAWKRHVKTPELGKQIIAHVKDRTAKDPEWIDQDGRFAPGPVPFLNGQRWTDHYTTAPPANQRPAGRYQTEGERRNSEMQQHTDPKSRRLTPEEQERAMRMLEEQEIDGANQQ